jgi:hypothetical protein
LLDAEDAVEDFDGFEEVEDNPGAAIPHKTKGTIEDAHNHNTILSSQNVKELEKKDAV